MSVLLKSLNNYFCKGLTESLLLAYFQCYWNQTMWSSNHFLPSSYFCISRSEFSFLRIQVLLGPDFSWFRFFLVQIFYNPGFFRIQVFSGPVFSWSRFFLVKIFHGSGFSWSSFFRVQVFQIWVQGSDPSFRSNNGTVLFLGISRCCRVA